MKKSIQFIFVILCLVIFALPILFFNKKDIVSLQENRNLAKKPALLTEQQINKKFFSECDAYFNDRFGGRNLFISVNRKINEFFTFNSYSFTEEAIKSASGWLFYLGNRNLDDFFKTNLCAEDELSDFRQRVQKTVEWCKAQDIPYVFMICPNKHSVYPEYYPFKRPEGITRSDQFCEIFQELGVNYLFPRDLLIENKKDFSFPLYYETDTHWNPLGAYMAFEQLKRKIQEIFPDVNFPNIKYKTEVSYSMSAGDLLPMLGIKEFKSTQVDLVPVGVKNSDFYAYLKNDGVNGVHTLGTDKKLPRAMVFRDSFFNGIEPFFSPLFAETDYIWEQFSEENKEKVLNYKPDVLVFEIVERNAPIICR